MPSHDVTRRTKGRIRLFELMALIAGLAVSLWLFGIGIQRVWTSDSAPEEPFLGRWDAAVFLTVTSLLGGLSLVGVPLLLIKRWRVPRRPWGPGSYLWFTQGMASWLLWPPVVYMRIKDPVSDANSISGTCYFYGTPLVAVYVTAALWARGALRRSRRKRMALSWHERFGLLLGLVWACTGLYLLAMFYRADFGR